jgi:radical SAM superfamily enzyme with C-terminal helix-hairpin-helix motif
MRALVLDGYTDEPSCLGVPPFISPYARLMFGAMVEAGADVRYATVDQWRANALDMADFRLLVAIRHIAVPGKYLRGMPASDRELSEIGKGFRGDSIVSLGAGGDKADRAVADSFDEVAPGDPDAYVHDLLAAGGAYGRRRTTQEWNRWLLAGARACESHPDFGGPLIAEMQMYRGCVRYGSGGCAFCIEPLQGEPVFRAPEDILAEAKVLSGIGVRNLRLGAQTCVYSYMAKGVGETETPVPNSDIIGRLLRSIREVAEPTVFHLDNANPAVIAAHPVEAREVTKAIAEHCTGGNVLALGLESADPEVAKANNLNATPQDALVATRIINEFGSMNGPTGLPLVLPGMNFLCGLRGETKKTYDLNSDFLQGLASEGLLLRRTNIRQVIPVRQDHPGVRQRGQFLRFKRFVREQIDLPMLERIVPDGAMMSSVYTELREGGRTFGRQVGTYPILIGLPYPYKTGIWIDVFVVGRGPKSIIGIVHPTPINTASLSMLEAIPGIGRRRAMSIMRKRPFTDMEEVRGLLGEGVAEAAARRLLSLNDVTTE